MEEKEFLEITKKFQSTDFLNSIKEYKLPIYEENKLRMLHLASVAIHTKGIRTISVDLYYTTNAEPIYEFYLYTTNNSIVETNRNKGSSHKISNPEHNFRRAGDFWSYFDKITRYGEILVKETNNYSNTEDINIKYNKTKAFDLNLESFLNNSFFKYFIIHYQISQKTPDNNKKAKIKI